MVYFLCKKLLKTRTNGGFLGLSLVFLYELFGIFEISIYHGSRQRLLFFITAICITKYFIKEKEDCKLRN